MRAVRREKDGKRGRGEGMRMEPEGLFEKTHRHLFFSIIA